MALPTALDNINATMYALDRLRREKCAGVAGLEYRTDDDRRMYPCPAGVPDCRHGRCVIATEAACKSRSSSFPFSSSDDNYRPYLEFRDGKCVYGNFVLRKWCESPVERRRDVVPGVTDVHPFAYDEHTGKCSISREYCERDMQASFKIDDRGRPTCYSTTGQAVGEFFLGKTVLRGIERVGENFAGPGLHLYADASGRLTFDDRLVREAYPRESYTAEEMARDPGLKRIYAVRKIEEARKDRTKR